MIVVSVASIAGQELQTEQWAVPDQSFEDVRQLLINQFGEPVDLDPAALTAAATMATSGADEE